MTQKKLWINFDEEGWHVWLATLATMLCRFVSISWASSLAT